MNLGISFHIVLSSSPLTDTYTLLVLYFILKRPKNYYQQKKIKNNVIDNNLLIKGYFGLQIEITSVYK